MFFCSFLDLHFYFSNIDHIPTFDAQQTVYHIHVPHPTMLIILDLQFVYLSNINICVVKLGQHLHDGFMMDSRITLNHDGNKFSFV